MISRGTGVNLHLNAINIRSKIWRSYINSEVFRVVFWYLSSSKSKIFDPKHDGQHVPKISQRLIIKVSQDPFQG